MIQFKRITAVLLMTVMMVMLVPVSADSSWESITREEYFIDDWRYKAVGSDSLAYIVNTESVRGNSIFMYNKTVKGSGESYIWVAKPVTVESGKTYKIEFDVKIENALSGAWFAFDWAQNSLTPSISSYDWTSLSFTYNSTKDGIIEIRFGVDNKIDGFWIDNIKLYDVENPSVNMVKNGDFEDLSGVVQSDSDSVVGSSDDMFSKTGTAVTLDGKADEWENADSYSIGQLYDHTNGTWQKQNVVPITGEVRFTHDEENLYFVVIVTDAVHCEDQPESEYWKGDSIQFGIADPTLETPVMIERGVALYPDTGKVFKKGDNFDAMVTRENGVTIYEVKLPWIADFGGVQPADMRFNVIVNNNDGEGRVYNIEITPGISNGKNLFAFNFLRLWTPLGTLQQNSYAPKEVNVNDTDTATVTLLNQGSSAKEVIVSVDAQNIKKRVTVEPGSTQMISLDFKTGDIGDMELDIKLTTNEAETVIKKRMAVSVIYDEESYPIFHAKLEGQIAEIKELMLKCEAKGLTMPYEQANYSWMCKYLEHFDNEASHGEFDRMYYYECVMDEVYEEMKTKLNAYLSGEEKPVAVPQYVTSDIRVDGMSNYAMTETNGVLEERPVFFSGYLLFNESDKNIPFLRNTGVNTIQMGMEFAEFMDLFVEGIAGGFQVEYQQGCTGDAEVTTEEAASGKASMKITNDGSAGYLQLNHRIDVEPKTTYVFGLKAKGSSQKTDFIYDWNASTRTNIASTEDWTDYQIEFTTGEHQVSSTVRILCDKLTEGLYIDDIYVVKKGDDPTDQSKNLIYDGDFEISGNGPTDFEKRLEEELGLYLNHDGLEQMRKRLLAAEKNNIYFDVGLAWNYFQGSYLLSSNPELTGYTGRFTPFASDQPKIRKAIEFVIEAHAEVFKDYECVNSVLIINEPQVYTNTSEYYKPHWAKYLKETYGTIEALNANYGSNYATFEEVEMPNKVDHTPKFYDWREFNDGTLTEYITFLVDTFKKYCPDINVHAKVMDHFRYDYAKDLVNGMNYEQLYQVMDYNGCDAFSHYKNSNTPLTLKMGWYDYMTSLTEKPVWDTESHPLTDGNIVQNISQEAEYVASDVWNGAIHGRGGSIMWLYDEAEANMPWNGNNWANANIRFKPDIALKVSETNLDMMRLSYELTALQNIKRKVGVVFSRTSLGYNAEHNAECAAVYESCIFSGQKPLFITDTTYADINKCEVLVIPKSTTNVKADMLNEIKKYMENGGKVVLLDDISLKFDEYNKLHDTAVVDYIYANAVKDITVKEYIENNKMSEVTLVDAETGKTPENVEWLYNDYNGKMLVNVLYYSYDEETSRTFKVMYNGKEIGELKELRSRKTMQAPYIVTPYEPVLFEFEI